MDTTTNTTLTDYCDSFGETTTTTWPTVWSDGTTWSPNHRYGWPHYYYYRVCDPWPHTLWPSYYNVFVAPSSVPPRIRDGVWELEIPGATDVTVTYLGSVVTVSYRDRKGEEKTVFETLENTYDISTGKASYKDGILTVSFQKAKPTQIELS